MKKLYIPIIIFIGMSINVIAQEKSRTELKGDKYAFKYSYDEAINAYNRTKHLSTEGQRRLAQSYHKMNQNIQSETEYSKLINASAGVLPEDYYNYAMVLKTNGKSDESNKAMDKFNELKPDDFRAKDYVANKAAFADWSKDDGKYKITHLDVNTDAVDFGTSYYKDKIVFSSSREKPKFIKRVDNWTGRPFLNMYVSEVNNVQLKNPENFSKRFNTKMNDGPASFNKEGTYMAFTSNSYDIKKKDKIVQLEIYFSTYKDGKWSKAEPFVLNNKEYSVGHPSLTPDGNTMYFSSNMPGGCGGADIYRITKDEKGTWGTPENMGNKINTEGDELFPFYEGKNGVLFFASNGRFGLGGLDIFICTVNGSISGTVHNAGFPLNTPNDDFAMIVNDTLSIGYFSSNRGSINGDDDIYSVDLLKLDIGKRINGFAKDNNGSIVPKAFVTLFNDNGTLMDSLTTKEDGAYTFLVDANRNFKLTGTKENYTEGSIATNTFGKEFIVKADVILLKQEEIIPAEKIKPGTDLAKVLNFDPNKIYFDVDKSNIRPEAIPELNKIVKIMNEYPDMVIELRSYTDCRASKEYNQILSDKRAKVPAWYIKSRITNPKRVTGNGYGETQLVSGCACEGTIVSTCTDEEFQRDRRTEFIIIKNAGTVKPPFISKQ